MANLLSSVLYWVITERSEPPTGTQVMAGQDYAGSPAAASGSQSVISSGQQNVLADMTGLETGSYAAHFFQRGRWQSETIVQADSNVATTRRFVFIAP